MRNTLKPQMHFISGRRDSSSTVTGVPQRMHSYVTFAPELSEEAIYRMTLRRPHFKL